MTQTLSIDLLRTDGDTQSRISINEETVEDYAELISESEQWPLGPLDVFHDGNDYFVADGFHRTMAAQRAKRASVPCRVRRGTAKDARIFGMTANDQHGLRMTRADKRSCVEWLLDNGGRMTQKEIAKTAGVTTRTVQSIVAERRTEKAKFSSEQKDSNSRSETGKSGGDLPSSERTQVEDVPVSSQPAAETESDVEEVSTEETPEEPTEPASDADKEFRTQKSKTGKTLEAAMRAFDDMNRFKKGCLSPQGAESLSTALITVAEKVDVDTLHDTSISLCKLLLQSARNW